jgi:hypothetical protein
MAITIEEYDAREVELAQRWKERLAHICTTPSEGESKMMRRFEDSHPITPAEPEPDEFGDLFPE